MPGDVRYAPYVNMAPYDPAVRPVGFRPHNMATGMSYHQHQHLHQQPPLPAPPSQQHQQQHHHHQSPAYFQRPRIPLGGQKMTPTAPVYPLDARSLSSRGWEYSSPGYTYYTPPLSSGSLSQSMVNPMILPPPALVSQSRYVPAIAAGPPRLPDRRIMPYIHPNRGFWVDQFASVDVSRQEPLPQDWHPFVDAPPVVQPAVTGGVMAILDYDLKVMADFVANVSCNFINLHKPWTALTLFVEKVLNQTRLPSSTVILGITYLAKRLRLESPPYDEDPTAPLIPTTQLYEYLTISFMLANKFLDDNTFTNTSWSDISGIVRHELNVSERDWLKKLGYSLHLNPLEQKGWSTWRKAWETWQFDATGKTTPSLWTPVLSRTNSAVSSPQCNGGLSSPYQPPFPSTSVGWSSKTSSQNTAYLTPPISPTFDSSVDIDFFSPITPPSNYQWPPSNPAYHPTQQPWRPLPNTRNIPMGVYPPPVPLFQKPLPPHATHFWETEHGSRSPWCECSFCLGNEYDVPPPKWINMAG